MRASGTAALAGLLMLLAFCCPNTARAARPVPEELTSQPDFFKQATPDQVRALLKGVSLKGVAVPSGTHYTALTPLMRAAKDTPYPEVIDLLIRAGCEVNALAQPAWRESDPPRQWEIERTALHFAAANRNPEVIKRLLAHQADPNVVTGGAMEFTALYTAARASWRTEHFIALLEAGADPELKHPGFNHKEPGSLALWAEFVGQGGYAYYSREDWRNPDDVARMTEALLKAGSIPDSEILRAALSIGEHEAALLMIRAGTPPGGKGVLAAAFTRPDGIDYNERKVADPSPELAALLIAHNDVNEISPRDGLTPLRAACRAGMDAAVVRVLVEAGAELDPEADKELRARPGYYPDNILLRDAMQAKRDNPELTRYLLSLGLSAETLLEYGPLYHASASRWPKPASAVELVRAGADPLLLRGDRYGRKFALAAGILDKDDIPLIRAEPTPGTIGRLAFERALVGAWAVEQPLKAISSRVFYSCAGPEEVRWLVRRVSPGQAVRPSLGKPHGQGLYSPGTSAMIEAAYKSPHPEVIDILVEAGHDLHASNGKAIYMAFSNRNPAVTRAVLRQLKDLSKLRKSTAWTAEAHPDLVPALQQAGLDLNGGRESDSPLREYDTHYIVEAARWGNAPFVRALMRAGVNPDSADREGNRALNHVISDGYYDLALELLEAGAECGYSNRDGTLLRYASGRSPENPEAAKHYQALMRRLEECGRPQPPPAHE